MTLSHTEGTVERSTVTLEYHSHSYRAHLPQSSPTSSPAQSTWAQSGRAGNVASALLNQAHVTQLFPLLAKCLFTPEKEQKQALHVAEFPYFKRIRGPQEGV